MIPFGETVWYRQLREGKSRKEKLLSEWYEGIWLGHAMDSNETLIGTDQGVVRAYSIIRKEEGSKWDSKRILEMKREPSAARSDEVRHKDSCDDKD